MITQKDLVNDLLEIRQRGNIQHFLTKTKEECILICTKQEDDKPRIYFLCKDLDITEYKMYEATTLVSDCLNLADWQAEYKYKANDLVYYSGALYRAKIDHTSSDTFSSDTAYWEKIVSSSGGAGSGSGGGGSSYSQVTKLSATAGNNVAIPIKQTTTFNLPPVEVLKFKAGLQNQVTTICDFNSSDSSDFESNKYLEFDGTVHLQTKYKINTTEPTALGSGWLQESDEIDMNNYKVVEELNIV